MASLKDLTTDFVKLEKFEGGNFQRWQRKMKFLLTTLKVAYVLNTPKPQETEAETIEQLRQRQKWDNDDYICTGHILNGLSDALFDVYQDSPSAKELWEKLEARYMQEDATSKKFLVTRFNNYKMVDGKSIMEQMHEIENILSHFKQHNMHMDETIIVSSIIDKLPPSWKDFKRSLKHRKDDISLEQLGNNLRLEEEYRKQDDTKEPNVRENIHVMEEGCPYKNSKKRGKDKSKFRAQDGNQNKKRKGACFVCGKRGHFKKDCYFYKKNKEKGSASKENLVAMISEINMIEDIESWWVDSGATRHVCKNKDFFKTLKEEDAAVLYMGNASSVHVKGIGTVEIEFTSGKVLTLKDVFYVPEVRKNLISVPLLNKFGFKSVFEGDKFILSKGGMFVGKGYFSDNMFKLNVANINNNINNSAYIVDSSDLWHNRLGHVNFNKLNDMMTLDLIPNTTSHNESCSTCMLTKITRKPFPRVERNTKILDLIHSDVCDLHRWPTIGGKKYFVTFIDDCTRYCYVYLMHSKDEVLEKFKIFKSEVELQCENFIKCLR